MRASGWGNYSLPYLPDKCKAGRKIRESDNPGQLTYSLCNFSKFHVLKRC